MVIYIRFNIKYAISFKVRNKTNVNVCLENIEIESEFLGTSRLDKTNLRLTSLPLNIGPRRTEAGNILISFPNGLETDKKGVDVQLKTKFIFSDRTITEELTGFLQ